MSRTDPSPGSGRGDASVRRPRDLVGAVWGLAFLTLATVAGWVALGHRLDTTLLTRWGPFALIALGLLLAFASLRRR